MNNSNVICVFIMLLGSQEVNTKKKQNHEKGTKRNGIAFGNILNQQSQLSPNNTDLLHVSKFAVNFAKDRVPSTIPVDKTGNVLPYKVSHASKLELVFTEDQENPYMLELADDDESEAYLQPLSWGYLYTFFVSWSPGQHSPTFTHAFSVMQYWDDDHYIFKHTYTEDKIIPSLEQDTLTETTHLKDITGNRVLVQDSIEDLHSLSSDTCNSQTDSCHRNTVDIKDKDSQPQGSCDAEHCDLPPSPSPHEMYGSHQTHSTHSSLNEGDKTQGKHHILKVLSFNIWNTNVVKGGSKSYIERIKHIAKLCEESGADIIGFQEVRFQDGKGGDWGPNQVEHLSRLLTQFQFLYQPAQVQTDGLPHLVVEGVAFFSRHPITKSHYTLLKRNPEDMADGHQRILLQTQIHVPGFGGVNVYNTHLSLSHMARATSVQEIWAIMNHSGDEPQFLMGDFNAETHNVEIKYLQGRSQLSGHTTQGLHDVWLQKYGQRDKGFTFNTLDRKLSKRIDFIFMKEHQQVLLKDVELLDDGKRGVKAASDHVGLLATFDLKSLHIA